MSSFIGMFSESLQRGVCLVLNLPTLGSVIQAQHLIQRSSILLWQGLPREQILRYSVVAVTTMFSNHRSSFGVDCSEAIAEDFFCAVPLAPEVQPSTSLGNVLNVFCTCAQAVFQSISGSVPIASSSACSFKQLGTGV